MAANNLQNENSITEDELSCMDNRAAMEYLYKAASIAYTDISGGLNNYTNIRFNLPHNRLHEEINHISDWVIPRDYQHYTFNNYEYPDNKLPAEEITHITDTQYSLREHLERELKELYARLKIVEYCLQWYYDRSSQNAIVLKFFRDQLTNIKSLITMNKLIMDKFEIAAPEVELPDIDDKDDLVGWFATREHLKILVYTNAVFQALADQCAQEQE